MDVTFHINLIERAGGNSATSNAMARLKVDLPFDPALGMTIEHPTWNDGRKVEDISVLFDRDFDGVAVFLGVHEAHPAEFDMLKKNYEAHGWEVL